MDRLKRSKDHKQTQLSGIDKIIVLLKTLSPEKIEPILQFLDPEDIEKIYNRMRDGNEFSQVDITSVLDDFTQSTSAKKHASKSLEGLLDHYVEKRKVNSNKHAKKVVSSSVSSLDEINPEELYKMFEGESNQTVAVLLSKMEEMKVQNILSFFEVQKRLDILSRIASIYEVGIDIMSDIVRAAHEKIANSVDSSLKERAIKVSNLMLMLSENEEKDFLENLKKSNEPLYTMVGKVYIKFTDILSLDVNDLQKILSQIDPKMIAQSMMKLEDESKDKLFSAMTNRASTIVKDEMQSLSDIKDQVIKSAQREIISVARHLQSVNEIKIKSI